MTTLTKKDIRASIHDLKLDGHHSDECQDDWAVVGTTKSGKLIRARCPLCLRAESYEEFRFSEERKR